MKLPKQINLEIDREYYNPIPAQQGDTARVLNFKILNSGVSFDLTGKSVRVRAQKPDGTKVWNDLSIENAASAMCGLKLTNQLLAVPGWCKCQLEITEGEDILSTIIFNIDIKTSIDIGTAVESTDEFGALEKMIKSVDEWDKYFEETSGKIEEKYTPRLNALDAQMADNTNELNTRIDTMEDNTNELNTRIDTIIAHNGDGTKDTEVIDGRGGELSLNLRMDKMCKGELLDGILYDINDLNWKLGIINTTGNIQEIGTTNIVCNNYILLQKGDYLRLVDSDLVMRVTEYKLVGGTYVFVQRSDLINKFTISNSNYYRFQITSLSSKDLTSIISQTFAKLKPKQNILQNTIPSIFNEQSERPSTKYKKREGDGFVNFEVSINCYELVDGNILDSTDSSYILTDNGVLVLPANYTSTGEPTRLIIRCHGSGTVINSAYKNLGEPATSLLKMGYAILDMNGIPTDLATDGLHFGAPFSLQSYIKGYDFAIQNYNLKKECFITGSSMGGLMSNLITQSGIIPVIAQADFAPVVDHFKQAWCDCWNQPYSTQRHAISRYFYFKGVQPTFTNNRYPSQSEIDFYLNNINYWTGYNPIKHNAFNWNDLNPYAFLVPSPADTVAIANEKQVYDKLSKYHPVPIKIWHCLDDTTVRARYSAYYIQAIRNCGGIAYLRTFDNGGHSAWNCGNEKKIIGIDGTEITVKASIFECILWFKRYDV